MRCCSSGASDLQKENSELKAEIKNLRAAVAAIESKY